MDALTSSHCRRIAALRRHLAAAASVAAAESELAQLPGQQLSAERGDGYVFTDPAAQGILSAEQRDKYERDGFLVVPRLLAGEAEPFVARFEELLHTAKENFPKGMQIVRDLVLVKEGVNQVSEKAITKLQHLETDPVLSRFSTHPAIVEMLPAWTGSQGAKSIPFTTQFINKPPDLGEGTSRHPLHQDLWYFPFRPASAIVCAWLALEHVHRDNGCLFVRPGSHAKALKPHSKPPDGRANAGYLGIDGANNEDESEHDDELVYVEMQPGDVVFFHPLLQHGSARNVTGGFRRAISTHYVSTDCVFFDTATDPVQRIWADRVASKRRSNAVFQSKKPFTCVSRLPWLRPWRF
jgi:phytanoyl-CoA hydroxylase